VVSQLLISLYTVHKGVKMTQSKVHKYVGTNEHIYKKVFNIDATYVCTYYTAIKFNIYRRLVHFQFVGASRAVDKDIFLFYVTCEQRTAAWFSSWWEKICFLPCDPHFEKIFTWPGD
jgi:hypothetical protein